MTSTAENILDVTKLEPKHKHPTIFRVFDELEGGKDFTIHNDHDPKPLYYQLLGERGNIFNWEYLEEGPEWWKVKITKRIAGENEETLGEMAAKDLRKAQIFKNYGLDFCCGGKKTVKEACAEKGIDVVIVEQELMEADKNVTRQELHYNDWSLDFLIDFIVNTHHSYLLKTLPNLLFYASKVAKVHGEGHSELNRIDQLVQGINEELMSHMEKEEKILFPFIKELVQAKNASNAVENNHCGSVQNPIHAMENEHEFVGGHLEELRKLTNNYLLPEDACASYTVLYSTLEEFEEDLHMHIHLENNILFPKAIALEKELN